MQSRRVADDVFKHRCFDYLFTECNVLFSYFFFSPFAIFDIRSCAVPSCYVPLFIFERSQAEQKAPKRAVVPQQSSFEFMRCPFREIVSFFRSESVRDRPDEPEQAESLGQSILPS